MMSLASLASPLVFLQLEIISRKQTPLLYNPPTHTHIIFLSPKVQIPLPPPIPSSHRPPLQSDTERKSYWDYHSSLPMSSLWGTGLGPIVWGSGGALGLCLQGAEYSCFINLDGESWAW